MAYLLCCVILTVLAIQNIEVLGENAEVEMNPDLNVFNHTDFLKILKDLEKRIASLEQPVWKISDDNLRWVGCNQGPCKCEPPSFAVTCYRLSLERIPEAQIIPQDILTLDIGSNQISALGQNVFRNLKSLIQLDFSNNGLTHLPENIFQNLNNLRHLVLQRNKLESLSQYIFKKLTHLETLDLSENRLAVNSEFVPWQELPSLKSLLLSTNFITAWNTPTGSLPNLKYLDLSHNGLQRLGRIFQKELVSLKLSRNNLTSIDSRAFEELEKLENLNLAQNKLEQLPPSIFHGLRNLQFLDLSYNTLTEISDYYWRDLTALTELNLERNNLEYLQDGTFSGVTALERIVLNGNNIERVGSKAFDGLNNLTQLQLANNMITTLDRATFQMLHNIKELSLEDNQLQTIEDEALDELWKLRKIKLSRNLWHCDCKLVYLVNWIKDFSRIVSIDQPKCHGPGPVAGRNLQLMTQGDLCNN